MMERRRRIVIGGFDRENQPQAVAQSSKALQFGVGIVTGVLIAVSFLISKDEEARRPQGRSHGMNSGGDDQVTSKIRFRTETLDDERVTKYIADPPITYYEAVLRLADETRGDFRDLLISTFASSRAPQAYFFETPAVNIQTWNETMFEFVLVASPTLATGPVDALSFKDHFSGPEIVHFPNLGGDAVLVVPSDVTKGESLHSYGHLAVFMRNTHLVHQQHALLKEVGRCMSLRVEEFQDKPVWLSTSGLGVYWLHVRLDSIPKYYTYEPYRRQGSPR